MSLTLNMRDHELTGRPSTWTPNPLYYDFGRPLPTRCVLKLLSTLHPIAGWPAQEPRTIFEPGGGTGRVVVPLASARLEWHFEVCDIAIDMLEVLHYRRVCESLRNFTITSADLRGYWPARPVDLLLVSSVLHAIPDWKDVLRTWIRVLPRSAAVVLLGEEGDLYNLALGRAATELESGETCAVLSRFWSDYRSLRDEQGVEGPERSQVGCRWEARNLEIVEELKRAGLHVVDRVVECWNHSLTVADLLTLVQSRCYSSMFTVSEERYNAIESGLRRTWSDRTNDLAVSRHCAIATALMFA